MVAEVETELEDDDEAVEALLVLDDPGVDTRPVELSVSEDVVTTLDGEDAVTGKLVSELEEVDSVITDIVVVGSAAETTLEVVESVVTDIVEVVSVAETTPEVVDSVVADIVVVSVAETTLEVVDSVVTDTVEVVSVAETTLEVVSGCVIETVVVAGTRPPASGDTAYGGSNMPKLPHALQGEAQDLTGSGATRIGSHRPLGAAVAITEGSSD